MTIVADWRSDGRAAVLAEVYTGPAKQPLPEVLADSILAVVVDQSHRLPDMFELVFDDRGLADQLLTALAIGTEVGIAASSPLRPGDPQMLMAGEVTAIEAEYGETGLLTVRGYTQDHRLQRIRRSRTFVNMSDADIAGKVAREAGLTIGQVPPTRVVYEHVGQVNQTDWDFLLERAAAIGVDFGVSHGKFFFGDRAVGGPVPLRLLSNLVSFAPRVTVGNLAGEAEVRVWDPLAAKVVSGRAPVSTAGGGYGADIAQTVAKGNGKATGPAAKPGQHGPPPSENAMVVSDDPGAVSATIGPAVEARAEGLAGLMADTFAEAVGESIGDPWLSTGREIEVSGVAAPFAGLWTVTRARHELQNGRYRTRFEVSGAQDRSLLGLTKGAGAARKQIPGVVCGIVTNNFDPLAKGRVKVSLPWLSPDYETGWASVVQAGAGERSGAIFLPETGDEVMVGFEFGDFQRPYVLGGIVNNRSAYELGSPPVRAQGNSAAVQWRGLVAPSGSRLAFHDELAGQNRVDQAEILLGSGDGNLTLRIDQVAGVVALKCVPARVTKPGEKGRLVIECGPGGAIDIVAGAGGAVTIDGGAALNLKAQRVNLEGAQITVNGTGPVEVKGKPIKLN
ncbi:VgrG-related protein [Kribbella sp. NBC_01505]|uniref:VgrG-related protein n=1 Tax=Kribbella sp. NBC_01505 TaxID=2903580 RepID=UPI0038676358